MRNELFIVAVALRVNGLTVSLPPPNRHNDVFKLLNETEPALTRFVRAEDEGFITSEGKYVTREQAMKIAVAALQVPADKYKLYSEDLW